MLCPQNCTVRVAVQLACNFPNITHPSSHPDPCSHRCEFLGKNSESRIRFPKKEGKKKHALHICHQELRVHPSSSSSDSETATAVERVPSLSVLRPPSMVCLTSCRFTGVLHYTIYNHLEDNWSLTGRRRKIIHVGVIPALGGAHLTIVYPVSSSKSLPSDGRSPLAWCQAGQNKGWR